MSSAPVRRHFWRLIGRLRQGVAAALLLTGLMHAPARAIGEFLPTFGNLGIDVQHHPIRLGVKGKAREIAGRATIDITATRRLATFSLDLSNPTVTKVTIDGVAALCPDTGQADDHAGGHDRQGAAVHRHDRLWRGARDHPRPDRRRPGLARPRPDQASGGLLRRERARGRRHLVSGQRPADRQGDLPLHRDRRRAPGGGRQRRAGLHHDLGAHRRYLWEQRQPMASYLAITDVDAFRLESRTSRSGVPIRNYLTDDTPADSVAALRQTSAMMSFIEDLIGPYPLDGTAPSWSTTRTSPTPWKPRRCRPSRARSWTNSP